MSPLATSRNGRKRRVSEDVTPGRALAWAALVLGLLTIYVAFSVTAYNGLPWKGYGTVYASVPEKGNLIKHDQVRIAGVRAGQVLSIAVTPDGRAQLKLQLEPGTKLPVDTQVFVRANGLLGARYVQLIPGHSAQLLPDGATIRGSADALTYGVPDAISVLDSRTRGALGTTVQGLGAGVLGNGVGLNRTIRDSSAEIEPFKALVQSILAPPGAAARLIPGLDSLAVPLNASRVQIGDMLAPATRALQPLVDQRTAVRATLDQAPPTLDAVRSGLGTGLSLLTAADDLATQAQLTLPGAPAGLRAATALLKDTAPLGRATTLLQKLRPTVPAVLRLTGALSPLLTPLGNGLRNAIPTINYIGGRACNVENFGAVVRSMTGWGGTTGDGPNGAATQFRLQVLVAPLTSELGLAQPPGSAQRTTYDPPCAFLSKTYPPLG
jgi:ABC-type transporter Mla subunit MlaD